MRSKPGTFREYHTWKDNFDLVNKTGLKGGYKVAKIAIGSLSEIDDPEKEGTKEKNEKKYPKSKFLCEPNLGKRGLYNLLGETSFGNKVFKDQSRKLLDFLQYSDGTNNLKRISKNINLNLKKTKFIYNLLKKNNLL